MGREKNQAPLRVSADRLAAVTGGSANRMAAAVAAPSGAAMRRAAVEPDLSRIRKSRIEETPEERKKRLAAKSVNFGASFIARIVILAAAGYYAYDLYSFSGDIHRGLAFGMFAMVADFGRVMMKAMEPGTK